MTLSWQLELAGTVAPLRVMVTVLPLALVVGWFVVGWQFCDGGTLISRLDEKLMEVLTPVASVASPFLISTCTMAVWLTATEFGDREPVKFTPVPPPVGPPELELLLELPPLELLELLLPEPPLLDPDWQPPLVHKVTPSLQPARNRISKHWMA